MNCIPNLPNLRKRNISNILIFCISYPKPIKQYNIPITTTNYIIITYYNKHNKPNNHKISNKNPKIYQHILLNEQFNYINNSSPISTNSNSCSSKNCCNNQRTFTTIYKICLNQFELLTPQSKLLTTP